MSASPSAERGNVEPSAEAKRLIGAYGEQQLRAGFRDDAFVSSAVIDARASLYAYVARLESAASPPSAPRAAGAEPPDLHFRFGESEMFHLCVVVGLATRVLGINPHRFAEKDESCREAVMATRSKMTAAGVWGVDPFAGSAPPSGAGVSEEEETPDEIRFRAYYAGYYDALPQPSSTKESDLALAMAEARKYVERHNAAPAPRDER